MYSSPPMSWYTFSFNTYHNKMRLLCPNWSWLIYTRALECARAAFEVDSVSGQEQDDDGWLCPYDSVRRNNLTSQMSIPMVRTSSMRAVVRFIQRDGENTKSAPYCLYHIWGRRKLKDIITPIYSRSWLDQRVWDAIFVWAMNESDDSWMKRLWMAPKRG